MALQFSNHFYQGGAVKFCLDLDKAETAVRGSWYFPSRLLLHWLFEVTFRDGRGVIMSLPIYTLQFSYISKITEFFASIILNKMIIKTF